MMFHARRAAFASVVIALVLQLQTTFFVRGFSTDARVVSSPRRCGCRSVAALSSTTSPVDTAAESDIARDTAGVDDLAARLLSTCAEYGQIGSKLTEEQRSTIDELCSALSDYSDPAPAQINLTGTHELIYSASPGGSSGAVGPFVGKVSQSFLDGTRFINRVELFGGAVKVELNAERKVLDENRIRVAFKETAFFVFGNEVKRVDAKGRGVWDYAYSGRVNVNGEKMRLRIMKTPSTFVIVQKE
ncbi:hypothetical protein ACHAXT_000633 [Thalassiosira profunda]